MSLSNNPDPPTKCHRCNKELTQRESAFGYFIGHEVFGGFRALCSKCEEEKWKIFGLKLDEIEKRVDILTSDTINYISAFLLFDYELAYEEQIGMD